MVDDVNVSQYYLKMLNKESGLFPWDTCLTCYTINQNYRHQNTYVYRYMSGDLSLCHDNVHILSLKGVEIFLSNVQVNYYYQQEIMWLMGGDLFKIISK